MKGKQHGKISWQAGGVDRVLAAGTCAAHSDRQGHFGGCALRGDGRADAAVEKLRQDKQQTVRNLKAMNLAIEQIAAATGLTVEEIEKL